jgi:hypothetical protein
MLSDDTFHSALMQTMASLRAWSGFVADVADIEDAEIGDSWHFGLTPHMPGACPVDLVLRSDQRFDLNLDGEAYEDRAIETFDLFPRLIEAVADGRVIRRYAVSRATGLLHAVSTLVPLGDGAAFEAGRPIAGAPALTDPPLEWRNVHYLPYRR